ncbi:MAG: hypothetical protein HQL27_08595, partial [Candidatus Omnitrophica bacterium]|nr:hypothetical protein [Candidatus Omnitrophota bacterium]
MNIRNEKGIALVISLLILVILLGLSSVFVIRTVQDYKMTGKDTDQGKSFYL